MMSDPPDMDKEVAELSDLERAQILSVLRRDEILRTQHQLQMMRLKGDLQLARRKGALKCGVIQSGRSCSRCRAELGRIINRGAFCRACRHRVCKSCREYSSSQTTEWVCTVCFKHMELTAASGEWINDFVHRPNKKRDNRISAAETVRHSIQRSWTFSDASPSPWSALRGSPELRAYSSMPRHVEDCDFIPCTLFTNRLNLTNKNTATVTDKNGANECKNDTVSDKESDKEDKIIEIKINDNSNSDKETMDKTSDSEPSIIDEHMNTIQTTDNDSSIGSPLIDKRSYSESTSVDNQSSIGSPVTDKRFCSSPLVDNTSCSGSPIVEKKNIGDSVVEPLTGTVFRKVTLRKRRVDTRNLPPGVTPPRSRRSLRTNQMRNNYYHEDYIADYTNPFLEHGRFFVPDGEDYKLVFISSSDSSSREELQSDDNSSTTSSGLLQSSQLDECDWDYFESSCSTVVKPAVKDWSWVNNGNNNTDRAKENNAEKGDLKNNENGGKGEGEGGGEGGQRQRQQQQTETAVKSGVPPPLRVVVPHRPAESQPTAAQVKLSEPSGVYQCGPISCVPVPIPVPIPVPFPILIPVPWQPDLTIRIQHSLAPAWSNLFSQQLITVTSSRSTDAPPSDGSIMTERADDVNKKEENAESSSSSSSKEDAALVQANELQSADEVPKAVTVSDNREQKEQQQSDNIDGVVLKMYKTLDDCTDNCAETVKQEEKRVDLENYSGDSDSSTTSDDENEHEYVGKIKRSSGRRIYRFNRADSDSETSSVSSSNNEDDESSGEFSMEASPPSSAASSDECIGDGGSKRFKKIFVVNDSDSDIGELPEYNDDDDDALADDGKVTLLKHVKHADNVRLSSILNDADADDDGDGLNDENGPRFIDLKSVLNDVKCGKTGSSEESDINSASGGGEPFETVAVNDSGASSNLEPVVGVQESVVCQPTDPVDDNSSLLIPADSDLRNEDRDVIGKAKEEEETCVTVSGETSYVGSSGGDLTVSAANSQESGSSSVVADVVGSVVPSSGGSVRDVERTLHDETVNTNVNVVELSLSSEPLSEREDDKSPELCDNSIIGDNGVKSEDVVNLKVSDDGVISNNNIEENRNFVINEFLTNEIDFCNKMNSVNSDNSYIYTSVEDDICDKKAVIDVISDEELGKSEGTRGSNTSDEFSGTESMELEQQGQIRSTGPVTCVEAAASGAVAGESCKETAAARYTSLVMITQEHNNNNNTDSPVSVITTDTTTVVHAAADSGEVHVVTGRNTLSAVVCLEDGLPDDDSWVEDLDRDDFGTTTEESSDGDEGFLHDREEELRGYHRAAIDFTLHTIVEESCEESEVETEKNRQTELEKYFVYNIGLGDGTNDDQREVDTMSETSSIYSEGLESLGGGNGEQGGEAGVDPAELASSRLEKYFLAFNRRDSDGSVGSDSEGRPSPEQRRKRLVRARGTGRQQSSSLDNLTESEQQDELQVESEGSSTETDSHDEQSNSFEKNDGQFDTVKRTKKKKRSVVTAPPLDLLETQEDETISGSKEDLDSDDGKKTPQPEFLLPADLGSSRNKQQSRDSGFMGSCDDLLKESRDSPSADTHNANEEEVKEASVKPEEKILPPMSTMSSAPPATGLTRKDSFNNWSSDEETNLMMSKMRAFFKTMVGTQPKVSSPNMRTRSKPPQLVYFESELTRLMKTVPGIRDEQVREIVEYLSSEDTWSDSYDSSDYTSSDLEGGNKKTALQEEISASCRQIISNFETQEEQLAGAGADSSINKDTAFVYQRLVASFSKIEAPSSDSSTSHSSPPLIAKVMQHIGSRLVALMHEVSGGEGGSPKASRYHRRLQPKLSTTSTTEDEEDSIEDYSPLPRSKSHDPLIEENRQEASDNERFSWRGSFESALMASDSRTRLASGGEASASALALAAKRRSAGDLLFKSCSREQLDRVRSCGSIGGSVEDKIWGLRHPKRRRSSVPDSGGSNDGDDDSDEDSGRSTTLPRSLQTSCAATNSLPRLPTSPTSASPSIYKAHSVHQFNVKSARYRPPGYSTRSTTAAVPPPRRDPARRRAAQTPSPSNIVSAPPSVASDDASVCSEPVSTPRSTEEDVDRLLTQNRAALGARSDSLASVYSGAGEGRYGSVAVRGEVEFGLQYNYKQGALEICVKQCRDLAPVDAKRNRSDPYVKVYLLPDKSKSGKRKTKVKKHTLNPVFEETLKFHITLEGLESRTLWLSVWHSDMFGRNDFLGEVTMALENKVFDDPMPRFYTLQERSEPLEELLSSKGELIVGLKFVPPDSSSTTSSKKRGANKGSLHVLVKEAKNLAAVKSNGTSDPFCKSYLLPDKGRSSKQKTPVSRRSCSPAWNHTFVYHGVSLTDLPERSLELTIWDHDRLASNEFLGGVRLNLGTGKHNSKAVDWMDSSGKETVLWQRMLERPNLWVESCLPLRPSLDVRSSS